MLLIFFIGRVLKYMSDCKVLGILVVLLWKLVYYWLLLSNDGIYLNFFVFYWLYFFNRLDLFVRGKVKNKLFGVKVFKFRCFVL